MADEQCINTEQYYHRAKLDDMDQLTNDDEAYNGEGAEYLGEVGGGDQDDFDQETI